MGSSMAIRAYPIKAHHLSRPSTAMPVERQMVQDAHRACVAGFAACEPSRVMEIALPARVDLASIVDHSAMQRGYDEDPHASQEKKLIWKSQATPLFPIRDPLPRHGLHCSLGFSRSDTQAAQTSRGLRAPASLKRLAEPRTMPPPVIRRFRKRTCGQRRIALIVRTAIP